MLEILTVKHKVEGGSEGVAWVEEHGVKDSVFVINHDIWEMAGVQFRLHGGTTYCSDIPRCNDSRIRGMTSICCRALEAPSTATLDIDAFFTDPETLCW